MNLSLSHAMIIFATYVAAKLVKGKDTAGSLFEVMVAMSGLSRVMRNAVS